MIRRYTATALNSSRVGAGTILPGLDKDSPLLFVLITFRISRDHLVFLLQADLDADPLIPGHLVVLEGKDGHAIWVSSRAMELSAPLPDTVEGGVIIRDSDGKPTGTNFDIYSSFQQKGVNSPPAALKYLRMVRACLFKYIPHSIITDVLGAHITTTVE
jgi:hypothetical protein